MLACDEAYNFQTGNEDLIIYELIYFVAVIEEFDRDSSENKTTADNDKHCIILLINT
jgi:hypothetical protein